MFILSFVSLFLFLSRDYPYSDGVFQTWPGVSRGEKGARSPFSPFFFSSNHSFHQVQRVCINVGNGCLEQHVIWPWIFVHQCTGFAKFRGFMWSNMLEYNANIIVDKIEM